jgi:hypothetical protein
MRFIAVEGVSGTGGHVLTARSQFFTDPVNFDYAFNVNLLQPDATGLSVTLIGNRFVGSGEVFIAYPDRAYVANNMFQSHVELYVLSEYVVSGNTFDCMLVRANAYGNPRRGVWVGNIVRIAPPSPGNYSIEIKVSAVGPSVPPPGESALTVVGNFIEVAVHPDQTSPMPIVIQLGDVSRAVVAHNTIVTTGSLGLDVQGGLAIGAAREQSLALIAGNSVTVRGGPAGVPARGIRCLRFRSGAVVVTHNVVRVHDYGATTREAVRLQDCANAAVVGNDLRGVPSPPYITWTTPISVLNVGTLLTSWPNDPTWGDNFT